MKTTDYTPPKVGKRPERYEVTDEWLERCRLPKKLKWAQLDQVSPPNRPLVENYIANLSAIEKQGGIGLFMLGAPGVGKSAIACILAREFIARGQQVYFTNMSDLRDGLRDKVQWNEDTSIQARMRQVEVLILDAIQDVQDNDHFVNTRYLVDLLVSRKDELGRFGHPKITILTSTKEPGPDLQEAVDSCCLVWDITGPNLNETRINKISNLLNGKKI